MQHCDLGSSPPWRDALGGGGMVRVLAGEQADARKPKESAFERLAGRLVGDYEPGD